MKLYNKETEGVISEKEFRALFPNVSFPNKLTNDTVKNYGYVLFTDTKPEHDSELQIVEQDKLEETEDGIVQTWNVKDKPNKSEILDLKGQEKVRTNIRKREDAYRDFVNTHFDATTLIFLSGARMVVSKQKQTLIDSVWQWIMEVKKYALSGGDDFQQFEESKPECTIALILKA
jgi:hypothetical protein